MTHVRGRYWSLRYAARWYAARGWPVFPLRPRAKAPLTPRGFKAASCDPAVIDGWWAAEPEANIGLVPGPAGLVVIDVDGPAGAARARALGLLDVETARVTTGRPDGGCHLYFLHPGGTIGNRALAPHLDVRADAGYVVVPPSVHPSGAVYRWAGARIIAPLPAAVRERLCAAEEAASPAGGAAVIRDPRAVPVRTWEGAERLDRRVRAYLARVGAVAEGARNATAYRVAAALVRDFALGAEVAECYLVEWNAGNRPPLGARELRACLVSAVRHARRPVGAALGGHP